ncbi:hypothetical protein ETB97_004341 [Aspergillus alliaceus]|uniref:Uncharacterized protein n=1 Tax=Petromyces alliaceus TaxID=209559 RepID=A0A8H6A232_PETAA|nr:hypothetical protein ETB97_004341 [Aspergillus burnettii]
MSDRELAMAQSRPLMWRELAKCVPGRSNKDCRRRWWNSLADGTAKGLWSEEEDRLLMQAVSKYGTDWRRVAREVVSRTPDQCSSHWSQVLDPEINHCDWTAREDEQLLHEVLTHGTNWSVIATSHVPRRTTLSLKNRYATLRLRHENGKTKEKSSQPLSAASATSVNPVDNGDKDDNGDKGNWRQDGDGEDDLDGSDSGHDDESGDEDDDHHSQNLSQSNGSNSTVSDLSMLPPTPVDWMNYFDQSGEFPSMAFSHDAPPPVAGLETDHNSGENAFVFGAILDEKTIPPENTTVGDPMDIMSGLSPGYPSMDTLCVGPVMSPVDTVSGNSSSATHQVSADMVCTDTQLESIIRTLVATGAVVNLQIKPKSPVR